MKSKKIIYGIDPLGYYKILGVAPNASESEIKQSYRDLAKLWHPDHNASNEAMERFQQLSVAYDVLKDGRKRLEYNLLAMAYHQGNFPDANTLKSYKTQSGKEDANLRAVNVIKLTGKLWKYKKSTAKEVCAYPEAVRLEFRTSLHNWLLGWWHPQAFFQNLKALGYNFLYANSKQDNLTLLLHNAVAYAYEQKPQLAAQSAALALNYANARQKIVIQEYLRVLNPGRLPKIKRWNYPALQLSQLVIPLLLVVLLLLPLSSRFITEADLMKYFSSKKEISYYQEVRFNNQDQTVDDMVVGKVLSIPVDRSDLSKLYHLNRDAEIMYGPGDDFDVLQKFAEGTTVRITGKTPDDVWYRVMIDDGDMGFIRTENLSKGIGSEIPAYSKIYSR